MKWFLAIPHYIVLAFLYLAAVFARDRRMVRDPVHRPLPAGLFGFVEGVIRWQNRVVGYALILVTDRYPPFSMSQREATPAPDDASAGPSAHS